MKQSLAQIIGKTDNTFWDRCEKYRMCDIDGEFLGFVEIYEHLAQIIPKKRIIVDLGCAYATQAICFQDFKKYIGVDVSDCPKVKTKNSEYYTMKIQDFIEKEVPKYEQDELFAICSYVPPWYSDNEKLVRENFRHCFVYYPSHKDIILK
jgi:hypothetical protein